MNSPLEYLIQDERMALALVKILGTKEKADEAYLTLKAVAETEPPHLRRQCLADYTEGYTKWILAGLPVLTAEAIKPLGYSEDMGVVHTFERHIDAVLHLCRRP